MCRDTSPVLKKRGTAMAKKLLRRPWTKDDVRTLKAMARDKQGVIKIAKALKRTVAATMAKASLLRVSLDTRG
jgi:hypothetical protein